MEYATIIKYIALQNGIESVDFKTDVVIFDDGTGAYIKEWNLPFAKPTIAEMEEIEDDAKKYSKGILIRRQRDELLKETDWRLLRDVEPSSTLSDEWKSYRQALRDMPEDPNFPNIDFPTKPSE